MTHRETHEYIGRDGGQRQINKRSKGTEGRASEEDKKRLHRQAHNRRAAEGRAEGESKILELWEGMRQARFNWAIHLNLPLCARSCRSFCSMAWLTLGRKRLSQLVHRTCCTTDQALQYRLHMWRRECEDVFKPGLQRRISDARTSGYTHLRGSMVHEQA
jgi:hypothetical protein